MLFRSNPGVYFRVSSAPLVPPTAGATISQKVADGPTFTSYNSSLLDNGNQIRCKLLVNDITGCTIPNPATSNIITMNVTPNTTVSANLTASQNPICAGNSVTFTATPNNGGAGPLYEFFVGSTSVQGPNTTSTYTKIGRAHV